MKEEAYANTQQQVLLMAALLKDLPLAEFVQAINHAETVGPILDPTLFIRNGQRMMQIKDLAAALLTAQSKTNPILEEMERRDDLKRPA